MAAPSQSLKKFSSKRVHKVRSLFLRRKPDVLGRASTRRRGGRSLRMRYSCLGRSHRPNRSEARLVLQRTRAPRSRGAKEAREACQGDRPKGQTMTLVEFMARCREALGPEAIC